MFSGLEVLMLIWPATAAAAAVAASAPSTAAPPPAAVPPPAVVPAAGAAPAAPGTSPWLLSNRSSTA